MVDESDRNRSFIIYGVKDSEKDYPSDKATELFQVLDEEEVHKVLSTTRLGAFQKENCRPIKVTLASADSVKQILSKAKMLKTVGLGDDDKEWKKEWKNHYLAPDRNREERLKHKKLVMDMKQLIKSEPNKQNFIRGGAIISVTRN